ncbi:hypothetical protein JB92DRAFT_3016027 [Gautieria morchelliformis]|nr:hypothetical protein JB92DRAFT_3016027 [Gautieria morchelliformis]
MSFRRCWNAAFPVIFSARQFTLCANCTARPSTLPRPSSSAPGLRSRSSHPTLLHVLLASLDRSKLSSAAPSFHESVNRGMPGNVL